VGSGGRAFLLLSSSINHPPSWNVFRAAHLPPLPPTCRRYHLEWVEVFVLTVRQQPPCMQTNLDWSVIGCRTACAEKCNPQMMYGLPFLSCPLQSI